MKKIKNLILRNKIMTLLVLISIILVVLILIIASQLVFTSSNPYGDRLDGIEKVEITDSNLKKLENKMLEDKKIKNADVYVKGRVINFIYTTDEKEHHSSIITNMDAVLNMLSKEEKEFYDIQIFIEGESDNLPIMGYKSNVNNSIVWVNR